MKQPNDLFDLVKSLDKNEKRFISVYAQVQSGEKKYMKLFGAIEKQEEYDEQRIKARFKGEKFINQLTFTKNYLYNFILRGLNIYHSHASADAQLKEMIRSAEILLEKSLLKQSREILKKARQMAVYHEKYSLLLEIIRIEKEVVAKTAVGAASGKELNQILADELDCIDKLTNFCTYWNLYSRLLATGRSTWRLRSEEELNAYRAIMDHGLLASEQNAASFGAQYLYNHLHGMYHFFKEEMETAFTYLDKACKMYESRPLRAKEDLSRYVSARSNVILSLLYLKRFPEAAASLDDLQKNYYPIAGAEIRRRLFQNHYVYSTYIYINTCEFEKGIKLVPDFKAGVAKHRISKDARIVIYFNIAHLYFAEGDYNSTLSWTNRIINDSEIGADLRQDVIAFVKIFNLVVHFELGNQELIDYLAKSTYRFLYKRERLYKFETIVLDFIRKYSKTNNRREATVLFKEAKEALVPLTTIPYEKRAFEQFDFISWLESKIEGKSFGDVLKSKM